MVNRKIEIDFSEHADIHAQLHRVAGIEERTPAQQIMYFIKRGLKEWIGLNPHEMES